jgi:hypothetical protein
MSDHQSMSCNKTAPLCKEYESLESIEGKEAGAVAKTEPSAWRSGPLPHALLADFCILIGLLAADSHLASGTFSSFNSTSLYNLPFD